MGTAREYDQDGLDAWEANHRMMNLLGTLLAIFRRSFYEFEDQRVRNSAAQFEGQILAASALLRTVSSTPAGKDVAIDVHLESLGRALSRAVLGPANIGCEVSSDGGRLPIEVCERLGYIIVELVFNASKYAFVGRDNGVVRIEMLRYGGQWRCTVSDNGVGMDGASHGMGLNIVDALVRSLQGHLIIRSDSSGTRVCVVLPDSPQPAVDRQRQNYHCSKDARCGDGFHVKHPDIANAIHRSAHLH
ncbi:MAG TPA: sensor histidine kinase [Rhizomicrobium sp.]|nr:sensor histidine kinase [Rhizomicrobium sp.]